MGQPEAQASPTSGVVPPAASRWKPGTSGNPGGVPKGFYSVSQAEKDLLGWPLESVVLPLLADGVAAAIPEKYRKKLKPAHLVAIARLKSASDPDSRNGVSSAEHLADRTEGKVTQGIDVSGALDLTALLRQKVAAE